MKESYFFIIYKWTNNETIVWDKFGVSFLIMTIVFFFQANLTVSISAISVDHKKGLYEDAMVWCK